MNKSILLYDLFNIYLFIYLFKIFSPKVIYTSSLLNHSVSIVMVVYITLLPLCVKSSLDYIRHKGSYENMIILRMLLYFLLVFPLKSL